jgi:hypothetical protein
MGVTTGMRSFTTYEPSEKCRNDRRLVNHSVSQKKGWRD